jgi:hypothetical protein
MDLSAPICTRCLLPASIPYLSFDEAGVCSECRAPRPNLTEAGQRQAEEAMNELFAQAKGGTSPYHVLVLASGGADSSYLLDLLRRTYDLNPLALHIAEDIGRPLATRNVQHIAAATHCDLVQFSMNGELVKRWVREGLPECFRHQLGPHAGRDLFVHLRRSLSLNLASRLGIPIVAEAVELSQFPRRLVFRGERQRRHWRQGRKRKALRSIFKQVFGDRYDSSLYVVDPDRPSAAALPALIFPNAILRYDKAMAVERLAELGLARADLSSAFTNTQINPFVSLFSYREYDAHVNLEHLAAEIRRDGFCRIGVSSRPLDRSATLELLREMKRATLFFAYGSDDCPDDLEAYGERFPRLRELLGHDEGFLARMRTKRKVRHFSEYFGIPLPLPEEVGHRPAGGPAGGMVGTGREAR